jgi:hypothetical protein
MSTLPQVLVNGSKYCQVITDGSGQGEDGKGG